MQDVILKSLWLQRLPSHAQSILTSLEEGSLDKLAATADKIADVQSVTEVCAISPNNSSALDNLTKQVNLLSNQLNNLMKAQHRSRSRSSGRSANPCHGNNAQVGQEHKGKKSYPTCWYHFKFGDKAHKCTTPCNFKSQALHGIESKNQ